MIATASSLASSDVTINPPISKFTSSSSADDGVAVVKNSDESMLNDSVDIPRR
jgi:hypothetical protein